MNNVKEPNELIKLAVDMKKNNGFNIMPKLENDFMLYFKKII